MISKHSTIPVPDSLYVPRKISFTFHFWHKSFIFDDVKLADVFSNSFEWKNVTFLQGVKTYSDPSSVRYLPGGHVLVTEFRGMTLNSLLCADVLRPLDLVPLTDFTCKYHPAPATYFSPFLDLRPVRTLVKSKHNPVCSRHATNSHPEQRTPCTTAAGRGGGISFVGLTITPMSFFCSPASAPSSGRSTAYSSNLYLVSRCHGLPIRSTSFSRLHCFCLSPHYSNYIAYSFRCWI